MPNSLTIIPRSYVPEQIWQARRSFFDYGVAPDGVIDEPVLRSWQSCVALGRDAGEAVEFDQVDRRDLARLLEGERDLVHVAQPVLSALASAVADAGYAVLLTDAQGRVLVVDGDVESRSAPLRQAFRQGVNLSETVIGTNAMSAAMTAQRSVSVLGAEHFFSDNQIFHCCAAPVFDPFGRVVGAVDVSRDMPGLAAGVQALTQHCARRIERGLFDTLPVYLRVKLTMRDAFEDAWLAFDRDAMLVAATPSALSALDLSKVAPGTRFDALFDARFDALVQSAHRGTPLTLRLQGGVRVTAYAQCSAAAAMPGAALARLGEAQRPVQQFGDTEFEARLSQAQRVHDADLPILITGETGVGKEVAARALHQASNRNRGPFVAINCGAIAPQLMAAELFGYVEGAYTGARRGGSPGKVEAAKGGTLFLDEIGDMPLDLQVGLLRLLDSGEVVRVGAAEAKCVDVRFVCATHRDLRQRVAEGLFREDLYCRISAFTLYVPPLRARNDFGALLDALLARQGCAPDRVSSELRQVLKARHWPGNIRQLSHALRVALAVTEKDELLHPRHFPLNEDLAGAPPLPDRSEVEFVGGLDLRAAQRRAIDIALRRTDGNVTAAAKLLGIGRATLYRRLGSANSSQA